MTPWVLLRGLTRESRHWGAFPKMLAEALGDAPVIPLDLPGNGRLHGLRSPARVEAMAQACRDELLRRRIGPPYRVLGMSLGAMAAVAWAGQHPRELTGGVLINTSLRPFSPFHRRLRPASYASLLRLAWIDPEPAFHERTVLRLTSRMTPAPAGLLQDWTAWRAECPVSRANALRQLLAAARFAAPRARPEPPLLILASTQDALVDVRCSRQLARVWQAPIVEHPNAGHDLPLDDGPWVVEQVRRWVSRSLRSPG